MLEVDGWYYLDGQQQSQGPFPLQTLQGAFRRRPCHRPSIVLLLQLAACPGCYQYRAVLWLELAS
jgi:hypothetical protein